MEFGDCVTYAAARIESAAPTPETRRAYKIPGTDESAELSKPGHSALRRFEDLPADRTLALPHLVDRIAALGFEWGIGDGH